MAPRKAFLLRINEALHAELEAWARDEFRSVNSQIEFLLRQAVVRRKGSAPAEEANASEIDPDGENVE